jgi:hypothetical protein
VVKVAPLLWEILDFAPNTKLLSSKIIAALKAMAARSPVGLTQCRLHKAMEDTIDKIDTTLRILMSHTRQLKVNGDNICTKIMRSLGTVESNRLTMLLTKVELPDDMMVGRTVYDMEEEYGPGGMCSEVETNLVPLADLPAASTLAVALFQEVQPRSRLAPSPDWGNIFKDIMLAPEEIQEATEASQPSPSPRLNRSRQMSEESLLASASSFQSQNLSVPENKKKDGKSKGSEKKVKKKKRCMKKKDKTTPIVKDKAKDTLVRTGSGQKPPESLRKTMLETALPERIAFHTKWGCTKCAWKRCSPSCWKSRNMTVP